MPGRFTVKLTPRALEMWQEMPQDEYEEADRIWSILEIDPYWDRERKHLLPLGDEVRTVYDGDLVWVQYHIIDNEIVSVLTCRAFKQPPGKRFYPL